MVDTKQIVEERKEEGMGGGRDGGKEEFVPLTDDASNTPRTSLVAVPMPPAVPGSAQQWAWQRGGRCSSDSQ